MWQVALATRNHASTSRGDFKTNSALTTDILYFQHCWPGSAHRAPAPPRRSAGSAGQHLDTRDGWLYARRTSQLPAQAPSSTRSAQPGPRRSIYTQRCFVYLASRVAAIHTAACTSVDTAQQLVSAPLRLSVYNNPLGSAAGLKTGVNQYH
jgi:hypothetical protein